LQEAGVEELLQRQDQIDQRTAAGADQAADGPVIRTLKEIH
jgi:hypothetical protein